MRGVWKSGSGGEGGREEIRKEVVSGETEGKRGKRKKRKKTRTKKR
jgi:hypothetical protein